MRTAHVIVELHVSIKSETKNSRKIRQRSKKVNDWWKSINTYIFYGVILELVKSIQLLDIWNSDVGPKQLSMAIGSQMNCMQACFWRWSIKDA